MCDSLIEVQIYAKVSAEKNRKRSFSDFTMPNRILYSINIAKGECREKSKTQFFRFYYAQIRPNPSNCKNLSYLFFYKYMISELKKSYL